MHQSIDLGLCTTEVLTICDRISATVYLLFITFSISNCCSDRNPIVSSLYFWRLLSIASKALVGWWVLNYRAHQYRRTSILLNWNHLFGLQYLITDLLTFVFRNLNAINAITEFWLELIMTWAIRKNLFTLISSF